MDMSLFSRRKFLKSAVSAVIVITAPNVIHSRSASAWVAHGLRFATPNWTAALAGASDPIWACVGNSTTAGNGTGSPGTLGRIALAYPALTAGQIPTGNAQNIAGGTQAIANYPTYNPMVTPGVGWDLPLDSGIRITLGGQCWRNTTTTNSWDFQPSGGYVHDSVRVTWPKGPTFTGTMNVVVDGNVVGSIANNNATQVWANQVFTYPATTGAVSIVPTAITSCQHGGVECFNSTSKSIRILNAGWPGAASGDIISTSATLNYRSALVNRAPNGCSIDIGINDVSVSTPIATLQSNIQTLITYIKAFSCDPVGLGFNTISSSPTSKMNTYSDAILQVFLDNSCNVKNLIIPFGGTYAIANAAGYMFDGLHPSVTGQALIPSQLRSLMNI